MKNLRQVLLLAAIALLGYSCDQSSNESTTDPLDEQQLFIGDDIAIANTKYGKVQGFILRGIYNFRGIPYGANTTGENRFMPPKEPASWDNVYPALWWGNSAPQIMDNRYANAISSFGDHWNYDDVSEDCLKLNVWTQAINDGKKRPVLVWLHGGGYTNGNGIEQDGYDGENLTRKVMSYLSPLIIDWDLSAFPICLVLVVKSMRIPGMLGLWIWWLH